MMQKPPMRQVATVAALAAAVLGIAISLHSASAATARREPGGAIRFYDDYGQDRGYAWCLQRAGRRLGGWTDCSYVTFAQCRAAVIPPGGDCLPNPFASEVRQPLPPQRRR
jgi:hypothetical protein